jgi:hypothetical protein
MEMLPLVAQYADWYGRPRARDRADTDDAPPWPSFTICLAASVVTTQVPRRFAPLRLS